MEVTTLLVPGENDSEEEIGSLARWLASVDRNIPLHLSRFFLRYRMVDKPPPWWSGCTGWQRCGEGVLEICLYGELLKMEKLLLNKRQFLR